MSGATPREWLRRALAELRSAEAAGRGHDGRALVVGAKRAGGMALSGCLLLEPDTRYGRSYLDHLRALAADESAPERVRQSAQLLVEAKPSGSTMVLLRSPKADHRLAEAARDVMAHAYARILKLEARGGMPS